MPTAHGHLYQQRFVWIVQCVFRATGGSSVRRQLGAVNVLPAALRTSSPRPEVDALLTHFCATH
ncbi:MAG TPA: hypothetical protein VGM29_16415 [Polyangiaceae bacterium]